MCNILYVEDEISIREEMLEIFELEGISAVVAVDGQEAWEILSTQTFDLMVTDLNMPRMDGEELIRLVRRDARLSSMPIAVTTGYSQGSLIDELDEFKVDAFLTKPFDIDEIVSLVRRLTADDGPAQ